MEYFIDDKKTIEVLEFVKRAYKKEHDEFHKFNLELFGIDSKKDNFYNFLKKVILMDVQSKPFKSSKYKVLKIFDDLENLKESFLEKNLRGKFKNGKELLEDLENKLLSITNIGSKIANLIIKNIVCFGDTEKYFGFKQKELLLLLKLPVDVHVKNLLCYRLQFIKPEIYNKINADNQEFHKQLLNLCEKSQNKIIPVDLDILWYIGYQNCNKRVYCNNCKIKDYCKDPYFETETKKNIKDTKRQKEEINFVRNHNGYHF